MTGTLALYIRLSLADGEAKSGIRDESDSITNQRNFIQKFIQENEELAGFRQKEFFDDGYSGKNFDRPGFQKMLEMCRKGEVNCIIVKDFSRLGRNYVEVGNLIEQVFPFLGVRVLSINDHYDSSRINGMTGGMDIAFKNLVYNLYSKDLSQKVKSAVTTRMKKGEYCAPFALFGYRKSKEDIHKLEIDPEAAEIVRRIFLMVIDGVRRQEIAGRLNREGVPTPAVYKQRKGCSRDWYPAGKKGGWNSSMIAKIIREERYAGHMVSHKMVRDDFESGHQVSVPRNEWIIVRNTHEGIVTDEEFAEANNCMVKRCQSKKEYAASKKNFSVLICPYCGLRLRSGRRKGDYMYCATGRTNPDTPCNGIKIHKDVAEKTLVSLVKNQAELMLEAKNLIVRTGTGKASAVQLETRKKSVEMEIRKLEKDKIDLYESYRDKKPEKQILLRVRKFWMPERESFKLC
ncbi:MAG: recombinase family protein [Clostridium sp.]|nr:recombinase family protein [Clostridium sp.]